jgi:hypothetical protein
MRDPAERLAQAREDLTEIVDLTAYLLDQALYGAAGGHLEAARPIPGGEALVMLGPVANLDVWARRVTVRLDFNYRARLEHIPHDDWLTDDHPADGDPPQAVLAFWDDAWRHLNRHPPAPLPTISAAANYLHRHMTRMSREPRARFDDFAADMHSLRARLETVLSAGERDEKGAPCLKCRGTLIRRTEDPRPAPPRYCYGHGGVCRWPARWDLDECVRCDRGGLRDVWDCPRCKRKYSYAEYWNAVQASYRANAPALTADDIAAQLDVAKGSIRGWASTGKVRRRGRDLAGRVLYDVADVKRAAGIEAA